MTDERITLILLAGCFWGVEHALEEIPSVVSVTGYAGGRPEPAPTYYNLKANRNAEAVRVEFEPADLRAVLEKTISKSAGDPSPPADPRYRRAIFCPSEAIAGLVRAELAAMGESFHVAVETGFHPAEAYHQGYFKRVLGGES